jgi:hypothetical protein
MNRYVVTFRQEPVREITAKRCLLDGLGYRFFDEEGELVAAFNDMSEVISVVSQETPSREEEAE